MGGRYEGMEGKRKGVREGESDRGTDVVTKLNKPNKLRRTDGVFV